MNRQYNVHNSSKSSQKDSDNWILQRSAVLELPAKTLTPQREMAAAAPMRDSSGINLDLMQIPVSGNSAGKPTKVEEKKINRDPVQLRTVSGELHVVKKQKAWEIDRQGRSNPPNIAINNGGLINMGNNVQKRVLQGTDQYIRAHLIKAAWDNQNTIDRMTHWTENIDEPKWASVEEEAQSRAKEDAKKTTDKQISRKKYLVTTITDEPNYGDKILGNTNTKIKQQWLREQCTNQPGGAGVIVNNLRTELNRIVGKAEMKIQGNETNTKYKLPEQSVGKIETSGVNGIYVKDKI